MLKFLLRRLLNYLALTGAATVLAFFLASATLNPRANFEGRAVPLPEASVDKILDDLNMNDKTPVFQRFQRWVSGVVRGDFGKTFGGQPVAEEMGRRIGVSLRLLLIGTLIGSTLGVTVGVWGAVRQYSVADHVSTTLSFVVLSTPVFLLAVLLKLGALDLNQATGSTILYTTGEISPGLTGSWLARAVNRLQHLTLPTISIALGLVAFYSRYQRSTMLDVMGSDFLRTAQAKGLRRSHALIKHGLRTALIPMTTFFAYAFGTLIVGATFTEKIFGWHGMGEWGIDSIFHNDINVVVAVTAFVAFLILLAGMLSDVLTAALDPRIRVR
jgi:peptide/nickel transport system permease protein